MCAGRTGIGAGKYCGPPLVRSRATKRTGPDVSLFRLLSEKYIGCVADITGQTRTLCAPPASSLEARHAMPI